MYEAKADYGVFLPIAQETLRQHDKKELGNLLVESRFKNLFLQPADHPMGYEDSISGVAHERVKRRYSKLNGNDRGYLYEMSEILLDEIERGQNTPDGETLKQSFLGVNHLIQPLLDKYGRDEEGKMSEELTTRLTKLYGDSPVRIKEWEAQIAENKGFEHMEMLNAGQLESIVGIVGALPVFGAIGAIDFDTMKSVVEYFSMPVFAFGMATTLADQFLLLSLQEMGDSPNTSEKLITSKHYKFMRHPLYGARMLSTSLIHLAMLNPLSGYFGLKGLYHGSKACQRQDERLRHLFGEEAEEYQEEVSAFIPGASTLRRGLKKILPENVIKYLYKPLSDYLERIPWKEKVLFMSNEEREEFDYRGRTHGRFNVKFGPKPWKRNLSCLGEAMGVAISTYASLPFWAINKLSKGKYFPKLGDKIGFGMWEHEHPIHRVSEREQRIIHGPRNSLQKIDHPQGNLEQATA